VNAAINFDETGTKLKNLLIFTIICLGAWQFFLKDNTEVASVKETTIAKVITKPKVNYRCDGRQHCSQMKSYEEAKYFIQHCPNTKMDGDNDGIPCERQFKK
jgi:hypothetical protein